jgi:hypothetical protein
MSDKLRVGFAPFGFYGYPKDVITARGHEAAEAVRGLGVEVIEAPPLTGFDDVPAGLAEFAGKELDAVIACVVAWTETPVIVGLLRDHLHLPILLWGLGGYTVDGQLVSPAAQAGTSAVRDSLVSLGARFL